MSGGLFALLDDISVWQGQRLHRSTTWQPRPVGPASRRPVWSSMTLRSHRATWRIDPKRELPIIKRITLGSLRNKLVFIVPAILLLNAFLPWLLSPLLMLGGTYLCFEGAEKIWEKLSGHGADAELEAAEKDEDEIVKGAVTTDFILSAEIMVISLKAVLDEGLNDSFWYLLAIMVVVAVLITFAVYGTVGLIVKMDDIGLALSKRESGLSQRVGRALVAGMPKLLTVLSVVGIAAMLWVGGHIILVGLEETGWLPQPYEFVHRLEVVVHDATGPSAGSSAG